MSREVDERVVSMQFDNKNFERNANTSIGTLAKLKQSLNLTGAAKGLENVNSAAKSVNFNPLANGVESVRMKFSALQVMGITALTNITNSAVNAGKSLVKSLTIDPVKTGFQEYETQLNAVQTILANTSSKGTTLDQVNAALKTLNDYADKTIYNFTEMTRNIGTFTAAGVDLDTSVNAIQGIANLAAVSGSTSQQASTAMYQLSQALAAGTVKLMDWNSVVNAGMGGEIFQNALKETSKLLGTGAEAAIKAEGSFRESLRTGWLTSEVLTETLKKFTSSGAVEYLAEYTGETEESINKILEETDAWKGNEEAINKAADALAKKSGKNATEIASTIKMAATAQNAATEVKTFTQLMDTLKESVQSGWAQTWQLIFGDFEEAKSLWSGISEFLTGDEGIITKFNNARNTLLKGALSNPFSKTLDKIDAAKKATDKLVHGVEDYDKIVDRVMSGEFGDHQKRWDKLTELGYDWAHVQNLVNERMDCAVRYSTDYDKAQAKSNETLSKGVGELLKMSDAELKRLGLEQDEIDALRELEEQSKKTGIPLDDLIEDMDQLSGRSLLLNGFKNIGQSIIAVFKALGEAWRKVFPPMQAETLYDMIAAFHKLTTKLKVSDETSDKLMRTFRGLFAIIDIIRMIVSGGLRIAFKAISAILSAFDMDILDVTAAIGDFFWKLRNTINSMPFFTKLIQNGALAVAGFVKKFASLFESFKNSKYVQNFIDNFVKRIAAIKDVGSNIIDGLKNGISEGISSIPALLLEIGKLIISTICSVLGIHSPSKVMYVIGGFIIAGLIAGLIAGAGKLWPALDGIWAGIVEKFGGLNDSLASVVKKIDFEKVLETVLSVLELFIFSRLAASLKSLADAFGSIGEGIGEILENVGTAVGSFSKVLKSVAFENRTKGIKNLAISLGIVLAAIVGVAVVIQKYNISAGTLIGVVAIVSVLGGVLTALAIVMSKFATNSVQLSKSGASMKTSGPKLVSLALSMLIITSALALMAKVVGSVYQGDLITSIIILAGMAALIVGMIGMMAVVGMVTQDAKSIKKIGSVIRNIAVSMLLLVGVVKLASMLTQDELAQGAHFAASIAVVMVLLGVAFRIGGQALANAGGSILAISVGLLGIVGVMKLVSTLTYDDVVNGIHFAIGFGVFLAALVLMSKSLVKDEKAVASFSKLLVAVSLCMLLMVGVVALVGLLSWEAVGKGVSFLLAYTVFVAALMAVSRLAKPETIKYMAATLISASVAIGLMAGIAVLLGMMDESAINRGLHCVGLITIMLAVLIGVTNFAEKVTGTLIVITVALGLLVAAVVGLSFIDPDRLKPAVTAIAVVMGMFALIIASTKFAQNCLGTLIVMTVAIAAIGGILYLLSTVPTENAITAALALSGVIAVLVVALKVLQTFKMDLKQATSILMIGVIFVALGGVLNQLATLPMEQSLAAAGALVLVMAALVGALWVLSSFKVGPDTVASVLSLGIVVVALSAALFLLAQIPSDQALQSALMLGLVIAALAVSLLVLNAIGPTGAVSMVAIAAGLLLLTVPLLLLSQLSWEQLCVGLVGLAGALAAVLIAGAVATLIAPGLLVLSVALIAVGAAAVLVGVGLLAAAAGLILISQIDPNALIAAFTAIAEALTILVTSILSLIPVFVTKIGEGLLALLDVVVAVIPKVKDVFVTLITAIVQAITETTANVVAAFLAMVDSILASLAKHVPSMVRSGADIAIGFLNGIADKTPEMINAGMNMVISLINGLADGIRTNTPRMKAALVNLAKAMLDAFKSFFGIHSPSTVFNDLGKNLIQGLINGVKGMTSDAKAAISNLYKNIKEAISNKVSEWTDIGKNLISGLKDGIKNAAKGVINAAKGVADDAIEAAKNLLGINSPSRVFMEIGRFADLGFAKGLTGHASKVLAASVDVADSALNGMSITMSKLASLVDADLDVQPTIRPVLDLSDVSRGAARIGNMFSLNPSVALAGNAGSINAMMNSRYRAKSNDDVVSAIEDLGTKFRGTAGDTYQINGITYDGGSEVSDAIHTLLRAIQIEGRK